MHLSDPATPVEIELSRAEQWVAHHVLLDAIGLADGTEAPADPDAHPNDDAIEALETLESGTFEFTAGELDALQRACREHARTTEAVADRNLATAVVERIGATVRRRTSVKE